MNLQKLKREIEHQSRNGRDDVYIKKADLKELIDTTAKSVLGEDRVYVPIDFMKRLIADYEQGRKRPDFINKLKFNPSDTKLVRADKDGMGYYFQPIKDEER